MKKNKIIIPIYITLLFLFFYSTGYGDIFSPGKLSWHHEQWDNIDSCSVCHSGDKGIDDNKCLDCHTVLKLRIDKKLGYHKDKTDSCATCHSDHNGKNYKIMRLDFNTFDHEKDADYALTGKHEDVSCEECHPRSDSTTYILGKKNKCIYCHESKHEKKYDDSCSVCHTNNNFKEMTPQALDHKFFVPKPKETKWSMKRNRFRQNKRKKDDEKNQTISKDTKVVNFELKGLHKDLECLACHEDYTFETERKNCIDCHIDLHSNELGESCEKCHSETKDKRFTDIGIFNHNDKKFSNFKLDGAHENLDCSECHDIDKQKYGFRYKRSSGFIKYGRDSLTKRELKIKFKFKTPKVKKASSFQLPASSQSSSNTITCIECHTNNEHKDVFGEKGNSCEICHTTESFKINKSEIEIGKKLDHLILSDSLFIIENKHKGLTEKYRFDVKKNKFDCLICHTKDLKKERISLFGKEKPKEYNSCITCHEDIHDNTLGNNCSECHTDKELFNNVKTLFDHNKIFELKDLHEKLECNECHKDYKHLRNNKIIFRLADIDSTIREKNIPLNYSKLTKPKEIGCIKCHEDKHSNELGNDCQKCHNEKNWKNLEKFNHNDEKFTKFKHDRKIHEKQKCNACHKDYEKGNLSFKIEKHQCEDCHEKESTHKILDYNPNNKDGEKYNCESCHTDKETWTKKIEFKHDNSDFDQDSHKNLECYSCHKFSDFLKETDNCLSCHKDYHRGYLQGDCNDCHSITSWEIPFYRHIGLSFTGSGVHEVMNCNQCHTEEITYRISTPHSSCVDCHFDDFKKVSVRDHYNASYDCLECHDESTWKL